MPIARKRQRARKPSPSRSLWTLAASRLQISIARNRPLRTTPEGSKFFGIGRCGEASEIRAISGGAGGDAEFFQFGARAAFFFSARVALDYLAQLLDARGLLSQLNQRHAFLEASRREFEALGIVRENFVVFSHRLRILPLRVGNFPEIELRIRSQIGIAVIL